MTVQAPRQRTQQRPAHRAIGTTLFVVLLAVLLLLPLGVHSLAGIGFSPVLSQSMQPSISAGDLVITTPVQVSDVSVGDVVVLRSPASQDLFSHRVVTIDHGTASITLTTQGDANPIADRNPAVIDSHLDIPVVAATVPFVGLGIVYLASPDGRMFGIVLLAISGALFLLRFAYRAAVNHNRKQTEK